MKNGISLLFFFFASLWLSQRDLDRFLYLRLHSICCCMACPEATWKLPGYTLERLRVKKSNVMIMEVALTWKNSPEKFLGSPRVPWHKAVSKWLKLVGCVYRDAAKLGTLWLFPLKLWYGNHDFIYFWHFLTTDSSPLSHSLSDPASFALISGEATPIKVT